MSDPVIPVGADVAELTFGDGSRLVAHRDTTGASRWQFRIFRPDHGPEPIASGTMTHEGIELFAGQAKIASADNEDVKGGKPEAEELRGEELDEAVKEAGIKGHSTMTADEKRAALAKA